MAAEPFIGELMLFAGNFAPRGWALCEGQLLPIAQNQALFSLLGTQFGGDGRTTFALPDLRGRCPIGPGQGPGLSSFRIGQQGGAEQQTLTVDQMPVHSHALRAASVDAPTSVPTDNVLAKAAEDVYAEAGAADTALDSSSVGTAGGSQPVPVRDPYLPINYCIALQGIFPSRN